MKTADLQALGGVWPEDGFCKASFKHCKCEPTKKDFEETEAKYKQVEQAFRTVIEIREIP